MDSSAAFLMALIAGTGLILLLIGLVLYVFKSIGFMAMASHKGIENAWLAWLPIADLYIAGLIVEEMEIFGIRINNLSLMLPVIMVGSAILAFIPVVGQIISLAVFIFFLFYLYRLFSIYSPSQATLFTVLSILCLWPIFIFMVRNNQPVIEQDISAKL